MFHGRQLLIATKHGKEQVIGPVLEKELGVRCRVTDDFDTDQFGTFSGEIKRIETALETARLKCITALDQFGGDLVVSSEGSFGGHPFIPFATANEELLMLKDTRNDLEIVARTLTSDTNFDGAELKDEKSFLAFLNKAKFPSHGIIIKPEKNPDTWVKCFGSSVVAHNRFKACLQKSPGVWVETDMRAMYNPTRMKAIAATVAELVKTIHNCCPECMTPGFSVVESKEGLPCKLCLKPTRSILSLKYVCRKCAYEQEKRYPFGRTTEDPMYCDYCNP